MKLWAVVVRWWRGDVAVAIAENRHQTQRARVSSTELVESVRHVTTVMHGEKANGARHPGNR